jgi:hypothetical protein
MVAKIELKMLIPPKTSLEYLLGHAIALNGEIHHYVFRDGMTTPCGIVVFGARPLPVARAKGRLCVRCARIVEAVAKQEILT